MMEANIWCMVSNVYKYTLDRYQDAVNKTLIRFQLDSKIPFSFCWGMVRTAPAHLFKTARHTGKTSVENTLTTWIDREKINSDNDQYHTLFFEVSYALR